MGFTIEDMLLVSQERYHMRLEAGKNGWSNSISWILMLEDRKIIQHFTGKELAVTTGLGFQSTEQLCALLEDLQTSHASGLVINTGFYLHEIPRKVRDICDENDFPLLTVPWDVYLAEMIKDLSIRIFLQSSADEQISQALIRSLEAPADRGSYADRLLPYFDVDGTFQAAVLSRPLLDRMDTVERRRIGYRLQLNLRNLTHNGHFFYYDSAFVIVINAIDQEKTRRLICDFQANLHRRMPGSGFVMGLGSQMTDIACLHISYERARSAASMAFASGQELVEFDRMGLFRLLCSVTDPFLLDQMGTRILEPLLEHDRRHGSCYVDTLEQYLRYDGSIRQVSEAMYSHRNTISYRMHQIRELLHCELKNPEERMSLYLACLICRAKKQQLFTL